MIFTSFSTPVERSRISVYSLVKSRDRRMLVQGAVHAWYTPTGHLVYADANSIVAVPFYAGRLAVNGTAVPALDDVYTYFTNGIAQLAVLPSGTIAYIRKSAAQQQSELMWIDRNGKVQPAVPGRRRYSQPRLSPDGQRLAITIDDGTHDVWAYDFARGVLSRVTSSTASDFGAVWTPDARQIAFVSERPVFQILRKMVSGGAPAVILEADYLEFDVAPEGQRFIVLRRDPAAQPPELQVVVHWFDDLRKRMATAPR